MDRNIPRVIHLDFLCLYLLIFFTTTGKYLPFKLSKILHKIPRFALRLALVSLFNLLRMSCLIKSLNMFSLASRLCFAIFMYLDGGSRFKIRLRQIK